MGKKVIAKQTTVEAPSIDKQITKEATKTKEEVLALRAKRILNIKNKLPQLLQIDEQQTKKAVDAILKIREKTKEANNIMDIGDDFIYLEVVLNKVPISHTIRPLAIKLPNPLYSQAMNSKFCVISTNPQRKYKNKIADLNIPLIQKVVAYGKLLKNFPTYTDKRKLYYEYDMFFCDQRLYSNLAKATGKIFYDRKKIPYPIECDEHDNYEQYLNDLSNNTYFVQGNGPVYTVKVARVSHTSAQICQNIQAVVYELLANILREKGMSLACLRCLSVKLHDSLSLPFFTRLSVREVEAWKQSH